MNYVYSAEKNSFYPVALKRYYEESGGWPEVYIEVSDEIFNEFISQKEGKVRVAGEDGMPAWADIPPPSHEELVALAEQQKQALLDEALKVTAMWRTELQLGIISDADKVLLTEWISYYKDAQAVDTDAAPDIEWPEKPQQQ